ncbi:M20/M25/M40 family metallo-hydrolase [Actinomadura darangshiensis]|uniref:M20/M25/M40 family metallo-hydrolase n=1 Tax=Actinomadura darangshiensis TaxID=705336 RepID=A0A4R5BJF5_9ACTN|nr:M20/M25/M40 family metallo-hydrolase [Actinomadura darangshiensis]TDD85749.1 M20/M25/M40 family metallo-hydrolase [Actinomadura darangshiensis]
MTGGRLPAPLTPADRDLLLRLLDLPTAGPLEAGPDAPPPRIAEAQDAYARHAAAMGLRVVRHAPAEPAELDSGPVPATVREAVADPRFLADQPSLVLRLGPDGLPAARTVMFNVHLDTVAGLQPARFDGERFHGRGAIDAKGPAVALLAGIRAAVALRPALGREVGVLVQAVAGEEGGAMGVFGTRPLVRRGFTGRLNVFCEPTRGRFLPRSTAAMTARIVVDGSDAVDDRPGRGHNATVLLGFLAQQLGRALDPAASEAAVCVAGLHTGTRHNKVYGSGSLLLNFGYASPEAAGELERRLRDALDEGLKEFAAAFAGTALFGRTAADACAITRLEWCKHGLPVLDDRDAWGHALLRDRAGIPPWPAAEPPFTCDAIWMSQVPGACTVVLGPGDLAANNAHADGEFAEAGDLADFAAAVARLLIAFTDEHSTDEHSTDEHSTDEHSTYDRKGPV